VKRLCFYLLVGLLTFSPTLEARKRSRFAKKVNKSKAYVSSEVKSEILPEEVSSEKLKPEQAMFDRVSRNIVFTGKDAFDAEKKSKDVVELVERAAAFLEKNSFIDFIRKINYSVEFDVGDLYLFVYNDKGICLAHGRDVEMLWKNFLKQQDTFGTFYVKKMLELANSGGGWVSYDWHNATKKVYVRQVENEGKKYTIGSGFCPQTKEDAVVDLVRGAVSTFYNYINSGAAPEDAFSDFSYPGGKFVSGEKYIYVLDKDCVVRANGFDPSEIGVNYWDEKDSQGNYYLRTIVQTLSERPVDEGRWFDFDYYNAPERDYVERVVDKQGNSYFIASGYNPYANEEVASELVKRTVGAIKERGLLQVSSLINDVSNKEFVYGRMMVFIYDSQGNVLANGERPSLAGKKIIDDKDESGVYYIKDIIEQVLREKTKLMSYLLNRAIVSVYVEELIIEGKTYIVGSKFFPLSKESAVLELVKSAKQVLKVSLDNVAFRLFGNYEGKFVMGDSTIFVYGLDGTCYADGLRIKNVWVNKLGSKDDDGHFYVKDIINFGKTGPAKVSFNKKKSRMVTYVEPLQKGDKTFIIGSGYYL